MDIQPGIKISCHGREGTLGLLVTPQVTPQEESGSVFLMSCWHTLDAGDAQGEVTLPDDQNKVIAHYQRSPFTASETMDIALAELTHDHGLAMTNQLLDSDIVFSEAVFWHEGMLLAKQGASTGFTHCQLRQALDSLGSLQPALLLGPIAGQESEVYVAQGDSGAVWYDPDNGQVIGLHSKGDLGDNQAAATPLMIALQQLNLSIFNGEL